MQTLKAIGIFCVHLLMLLTYTRDWQNGIQLNNVNRHFSLVV